MVLKIILAITLKVEIFEESESTGTFYPVQLVFLPILAPIPHHPLINTRVFNTFHILQDLCLFSDIY